jgi:peptidoglycan L-alanyl-D-glutamate endopeptidase CwlK
MKILVLLTLLVAATCCVQNAQTSERVIAPQKPSPPGAAPEATPSEGPLPDGVVRLMKAYPEHIVGGSPNEVRWKDGSVMLYDDGLGDKTFVELLNNPDLEDGFRFAYDTEAGSPSENHDPGRIRYEPFFLKMYGSTREEVKANLIEVVWLPKTVNQKILVTRVNGVSEKIKAISEELNRMPEFRRYLENIGGTFNWRKISGTDRLSTHSFGITMDINTRYSNYWQWDCKCTDEGVKLNHRNKIPLKVVEVFEKHGFIWGGRWYHYDTMHFEYRPELLIK